MLDEIFVVNLDRDVARLAEFCRVNAHVLGRVRRFAAVDGRALDRAALVQAGLLEANSVFSAAALGCAVSHLTLWAHAARTGVALTVVEDDAVLAADFVPRGRAVLAALPSDWDVLLWGWNFDSPLAVDLVPGALPAYVFVDDKKLRSGLAAFQAEGARAVPVRLRHACGTLGYAVSAKGARALLARVLPLHGREVNFPEMGVRQRNGGIDEAMNEVFGSLLAFVSLPPLALSENRKDMSTIFRAG